MGKKQYVACTESDIPSGVRFDVPARYAGQIVEVSFGGYGRAEQDVGAPYKMVVDRLEPTDSPDRVTYYRLDRPPPSSPHPAGVIAAGIRRQEVHDAGSLVSRRRRNGGHDPLVAALAADRGGRDGGGPSHGTRRRGAPRRGVVGRRPRPASERRGRGRRRLVRRLTAPPSPLPRWRHSRGVHHVEAPFRRRQRRDT